MLVKMKTMRALRRRRKSVVMRMNSEEVKKIIGAEVESAAPGYSYWKCDQDNKKKQCVEYTKSREFRGGRG